MRDRRQVRVEGKEGRGGRGGRGKEGKREGRRGEEGGGKPALYSSANPMDQRSAYPDMDV